MAAVYGGSPRIYGRATPLLYCPTHPRRFLFLASLFLSSASFPHVSPIRAATRADRIAASRRLSNRKPDAGDRESSSPKDDFVVASFYKFVLLEDPEAQVTKHLAFLQGLDIHGRIYVNEQGINAQYSGPYKDALAYADWVKEDDKFSDILVQTSPAFSGHAFPRLKLRWKEVFLIFL